MKARSVGTFLEIDGLFFNMARVVEGSISDNEACLYFLPRIGVDDLEEEYPVILKGERREAFLEWWERQAERTRASQPHYIAFKSGAILMCSGTSDPEGAWEGPNTDWAWFADMEANCLIHDK